LIRVMVERVQGVSRADAERPEHGNGRCLSDTSRSARSGMGMPFLTRCVICYRAASADRHQARIATRRRGVDAQCPLDHQTFQRHVGFAVGQAVDTDDGTTALCDLLADGT